MKLVNIIGNIIGIIIGVCLCMLVFGVIGTPLGDRVIFESAGIDVAEILFLATLLVLVLVLALISLHETRKDPESKTQLGGIKMKFRKKPVVVEAERLTERIEIETLEGVMVGNPGDWLITGIAGERYPCKDDIFRATYEEIGDGDA